MKLLDQVRQVARLKHLAYRTELRTVQELLGHSDVRTTMIYTHVMQKAAGRVPSPLNGLAMQEGAIT